MAPPGSAIGRADELGVVHGLSSGLGAVRFHAFRTALPVQHGCGIVNSDGLPVGACEAVPGGDGI